MTNDKKLLSNLQNLNHKQLEEIVQYANVVDYDGNDLGLLADILYAFFPQIPISVIDKHYNTRESILYLEDLLSETRVK